MAKDKKICSVLTLPLVTEPWQKDALDLKMECVRKVYNSMLRDMLKKYHEMIKTKEWRQLNDTIRMELQKNDDGKKKKSPILQSVYDRKNQILRDNGFSEFGFISTVAQYNKYYQKHVSSSIAARCVATPMWRAFEKLLFGNGEKVSFKSFGSVTSIASEGRTGIRFVEEADGYYVVFSNRVAKARVVKLKVKGPETVYDKEMLNAKIKMVRVIRKLQKGRREYYCQLTLECPPYLKKNADGGLVHPVGIGKVGICVWRNTLCAVSNSKVVKYNLVPNGDDFVLQRSELSKKMEEIHRRDNPDN